MSPNVIVRPIARREIDDSIDLYAERKPGLGDELAEHFRSILREIREQPTRFPLRTRITRVATIIRFHFDVCYRVLPDGDILIVAFYHHARKPDGWKGRR